MRSDLNHKPNNIFTTNQSLDLLCLLLRPFLLSFFNSQNPLINLSLTLHYLHPNTYPITSTKHKYIPINLSSIFTSLSSHDQLTQLNYAHHHGHRRGHP